MRHENALGLRRVNLPSGTCFAPPGSRKINCGNPRILRAGVLFQRWKTTRGRLGLSGTARQNALPMENAHVGQARPIEVRESVSRRNTTKRS